MGFLFFRQLAFEACWFGRCIFFFRTLLVQVAAPGTQTTTGRFLTVYPNVAKLLAGMTLRKNILSFIGLCPDCAVAKTWQSENFLGFCRSKQGYEEQGSCMVVDSVLHECVFSESMCYFPSNGLIF
jgi:hypothetical protein